MKRVFVLESMLFGLHTNCFSNKKVLYRAIEKLFPTRKEGKSFPLQFSVDVKGFDKRAFTYPRLLGLISLLREEGKSIRFSVQPTERYGKKCNFVTVTELSVVSKTL